MRSSTTANTRSSNRTAAARGGSLIDPKMTLNDVMLSGSSGGRWSDLTGGRQKRKLDDAVSESQFMDPDIYSIEDSL